MCKQQNSEELKMSSLLSGFSSGRFDSLTLEMLSEQEKPDSKSTVKLRIFPRLLHM